MKPMRVDAGPLVRAICEQMEVVPISNDMAPWDRQRCKLSPGELIFALTVCRRAQPHRTGDSAQHLRHRHLDV
jgi:hypothetical protein